MDITCVTIDCADHRALAEFWAAALGWAVTTHEYGSIVAKPGVRGLYLEFVVVPEPKTVKNRVHLGHEAVVDDLDTEIARLEALGATVAWEEDFEDFEGIEDMDHYRNVVLRDPEGNEFCLGWHHPDHRP